MATVRFRDQTKNISYEFETEGKEGRALHQIYMHLSLFPADAVDLEWQIVADEEVPASESISPVSLPYSAVHEFGVKTSEEDREGPFQMEYSSMMHSIRDEKKLVLRVLSQIS